MMNKQTYRWGATLLLALVLFLPAFSHTKRAMRERFLAKAEVPIIGERLKKEWMKTTRARLGLYYRARTLTHNEVSMPLWWTVYGDKPADGYSLFISLHGGGGTTQEVNNQQWENQKYLYRPQQAVYVAPRAPWNLWNMWCHEGIDALYEQLIQMCVAFEGVNPDKVYLMGYSAGGDGVWRMAPRMADSWAAASMMAGHPGDVSLLNLRNLPFMIWCGEHDAAYNRNTLAAQRGLQMDSLQQHDPTGYVHQTHIIKGAGHWMNRVDSAAVPWMQRFRRNPYPKQIVWQQAEVVKPYFYWLGAPKQELAPGKMVRASIRGNQVDVTECDYSSLTIYLNDDLVDLDKAVTIKYGKRLLFRGRVRRKESTMRQTLTQRNDWAYMFPAMIEVNVESKKR
ncbi:alpha/beta hydrolase family protein [Prevotella sp. BV3P1]|uniref:alpha/beta hydrolase n=1 Tax=Prevotellaceae TaxID=171552 RepID=UPI0003B84275|nr:MULTISPECIES: alpha/beta hydrolase [Prevotellaceae]ERT62532.1 alpha/beta hydrolase family protein [Prevotella sp. BV3P1]KGF38745.1 hypothetical protein HMPREF2140_11270 [Hoylesella buccalis DNF00985]